MLERPVQKRAACVPDLDGVVLRERDPTPAEGEHGASWTGERSSVSALESPESNPVEALPPVVSGGVDDDAVFQRVAAEVVARRAAAVRRRDLDRRRPAGRIGPKRLVGRVAARVAAVEDRAASVEQEAFGFGTPRDRPGHCRAAGRVPEDERRRRLRRLRRMGHRQDRHTTVPDSHLADEVTRAELDALRFAHRACDRRRGDAAEDPVVPDGLVVLAAHGIRVRQCARVGAVAVGDPDLIQVETPDARRVAAREHETPAVRRP